MKGKAKMEGQGSEREGKEARMKGRVRRGSRNGKREAGECRKEGRESDEVLVEGRREAGLGRDEGREEERERAMTEEGKRVREKLRWKEGREGREQDGE